MDKLIVVMAILFCGLLKTSHGLDCETSWTPFQDSKCIKFVDSFVTADVAEALCISEIGGKAIDEDDIPVLLTIKSEEEQDFMTKYIFEDLQLLDSVWLGARRVANGSVDFVWPDDSTSLEFTNWHEGYPSLVEGNDCTQMVPKVAKMFSSKDFKLRGGMDRDEVDGRWTDIACQRRNLVICQKLQTWSLKKVQKISLETTRELIKSTQKLRNLEENPVPLGFVYVQLPNQPDAKSTWPQVQWDDVTQEYAGLFFRAEGGTAAQFGAVQEDQCRRVTNVRADDNATGQDFKWNMTLVEGDWSDKFYIGRHLNVNNEDHYDVMWFYTNDDEVRPRNTAVRIWKRI